VRLFEFIYSSSSIRVHRRGEGLLPDLSLPWRMLKVSRSGYYGWKDRSPSKRDRENAALTEKITEEIHNRSPAGDLWLPTRPCRAQGSGSALLQEERVARLLMREAGLQGCCIRGRRKRTTRPDERAVPAPPDLVDRNFAASAPDKIWGRRT
jgi:putative transposase